jgi:hypothetical protein
VVELAVAAEEAGWDGVFVWDTLGGPEYDELFEQDALRRAAWDPWVLLTAIATATERVRLGTMVTPLSRRRPWKLASEVATLDQLSEGRVTLSVSLGWVPDAAFTAVHEELSRPVRAERLDEALDILTSMWASARTTFGGAHFSMDAVPGVAPCQQPRVPVWVVGAWPRTASMRRALRLDGLIPRVFVEGLGWIQPEPEALGEISRGIAPDAPTGFDIVVEGNSSREPAKAAARVSPYRDAGASWWLEGVWSFLAEPDRAHERMLARIRAGPPAVGGGHNRRS